MWESTMMANSWMASLMSSSMPIDRPVLDCEGSQYCLSLDLMWLYLLYELSTWVSCLNQRIRKDARNKSWMIHTTHDTPPFAFYACQIPSFGTRSQRPSDTQRHPHRDKIEVRKESMSRSTQRRVFRIETDY